MIDADHGFKTRVADEQSMNSVFYAAFPGTFNDLPFNEQVSRMSRFSKQSQADDC